MHNSPSSIHWPATISLLCSILLWSITPLFLRAFIHEIDGWTANGSRYTMAALFWMIPLILSCRKGLVIPQWFLYAIIPSLVNIIAQSLWAWTVYFMEPGMVAFLSRLSLLFTVMASFILFPDELALAKSPYFWWGLALLLIGFIGLNVFRGNIHTRNNWIGLIIVLGNAVFSGFYGVSVRYWMKGVRPWMSFSIISLYTAGGLLILMFLFGHPGELLEMRPHRMGLLIISSFVGITFAHVTYYHAIEYLGASISAGCQLSLPFLTTIGSYFIYHEIFSWEQWMFGLGLLGGSGLLLLAQKHLGHPRLAVPACPVPEIESLPCKDNK